MSPPKQKQTGCPGINFFSPKFEEASEQPDLSFEISFTALKRCEP